MWCATPRVRSNVDYNRGVVPEMFFFFEGGSGQREPPLLRPCNPYLPMRALSPQLVWDMSTAVRKRA